ncbi:UV DNA damage repair endonuclease UvsE [Hymenobacter weizhouensis]|uniref:UV DNA damage repair endonuclease UvsE n=1 Tax=Hymenobacter sp. YIM 151500-1 TaxID=2987689 RepID=UPI0022262455|nr:UV DNA damage repair endonuclease UvsE [Hymenobacter sp. YIM 151500-1]UYZ61554.1 UV DNA damage repair endonuclease UvsE [Hymenobacter sp. YIM 151500-1]
MRIGYPCVNESLDCTSTSTFRLASYSDERVEQAVANNLACLQRILEYNVEHGLLFFRIGSGIVPFGSHPINTYPWQTRFAAEFRAIGDYIKAHDMRVSFHPDQFVVLNSPNPDIVQRSIEELVYQGSMLDLMGLDSTAKLQIHLGGLYGDRDAAIERFISVWHTLPEAVQVRLVVENDDRLFSLQDCLRLHAATGTPILFDNFHHECLNNGEPMPEALRLAAATWHPTRDGVMMMDYSSQSPGERRGKHVASIEEDLFRSFLQDLGDLDADIMLEIKDKEVSAHKACGIMRELALLPPARPGYAPPTPKEVLAATEGPAPKKPRRKTAKVAEASAATQPADEAAAS